MPVHVDDDESVYNLIPRPQVVAPRPPMYKSKFEGRVDPSELGGTKTRASATMGRANGLNAEHPATFLRKHAKEPALPEPGPPTMKKDKVKPAVPTREEKPVMGLVSNKNFITTNAVEVILASAKKKTQEELPATMRPGFGKVPAYLRRNKEAITNEKQQLETFMRLRQQPDDSDRVQPMSEHERQDLLRHLKDKWATMNATYQKIGFVLDIESKIKRKEELEAQLAEIEKDIKTLERGDVVLIVHE